MITEIRLDRVSNVTAIGFIRRGIAILSILRTLSARLRTCVTREHVSRNSEKTVRADYGCVRISGNRVYKYSMKLDHSGISN